MEWDVLKALWRILELSGGEDVLGQARKLARNEVMETAVARLARVRDLVEEAGFGERLAFDFGLMQDLDYYSGLLLEAYAPGVGLPLASGGRYDGLLARFDWDIPGVGFAVAVDRPPTRSTRPAWSSPRRAGRDPVRRRARSAGAGGGAPPRRSRRHRPARDGGRVEPPLLLRHGGSYTLRLADGRELNGGAREIAEALGAG